MTEATRQRVLLLRRAGMLWGIAHAAVHDVTRVARRRGSFRVRLTGEGQAELTADELVGVVDDLPVWPAGGVMERYWSEPVGGLTVHAATPMVMVDPARPPSFLRPDEETERADVDDR
jgi:hypothetical protein